MYCIRKFPSFMSFMSLSRYIQFTCAICIYHAYSRTFRLAAMTWSHESVQLSMRTLRTVASTRSTNRYAINISHKTCSCFHFCTGFVCALSRSLTCSCEATANHISESIDCRSKLSSNVRVCRARMTRHKMRRRLRNGWRKLRR